VMFDAGCVRVRFMWLCMRVCVCARVCVLGFCVYLWVCIYVCFDISAFKSKVFLPMIIALLCIYAYVT